MSEHDTATRTDTDAGRTEKFRSWTESSDTGTIDGPTKVQDEAERAVEQAEGRA